MSRRRIAVIGPVFPYRGGIAQHTSMLCKALQASHETVIISFARQYPAFLYPGKDDRDADSPSIGLKNLHFVIDSLNPITWRRAGRMIKDFGPDTVIIPWWTFFLAPCLRSLAKKSRSTGAHVRFLCHNTVDHEKSVWKEGLSDWVLRTGHSYLVHTNEDRLHLKRRLGEVQICVHAHPIYDQFPPAARKLPRRASLELLFFGLVRPYKGLDILIEALDRLGDVNWHLSIVGEFWSDLERTRKRIAELGLESRIEIIPRYVSDQEAADHFARADVIVLPYRSATGSGVIPVAYHYNKPVIATHVGGLPDVVEQGRTGILVDPESPEALAEAIAGLSPEWLDEASRHIAEFKKSLTWESLAEAATDINGHA